MKVTILNVGRTRGPLAPAIAEYERRAGRYFAFDTIEVREYRASRNEDPQRVMSEEGQRLLDRVPESSRVVALDRTGDAWSSERLAGYLSDLALHAAPGATFVIGGALGLAASVLERADHVVSLSAMTFPHDVARLLLTEQIYRAGTIARGEPYHKGSG